jgi:hypothetical protein
MQTASPSLLLLLFHSTLSFTWPDRHTLLEEKEQNCFFLSSVLLLLLQLAIKVRDWKRSITWRRRRRRLGSTCASIFHAAAAATHLSGFVCNLKPLIRYEDETGRKHEEKIIFEDDDE